MNKTPEELRAICNSKPNLEAIEWDGLFVFPLGECPRCGEPLILGTNGGKLGQYWSAFHALTDAAYCGPRHSFPASPEAPQHVEYPLS